MHPILFQTEFFTLHTYWIFFALALILGTYVFIKFSIYHRLKLQFISSNSTALIFYGLIGARIAAVIENYQIYFAQFDFTSLLRIFAFWDRNFSLWGAIIAAGIYFYKICKEQEQDFWKWLDAIVPAFIFALIFHHIGAFFEGLNYGNETSLPWGVNFESPAIKYAVPIHPTQIYATLYSITLTIVLVWLSNNDKVHAFTKSGFIGLIGIISYNLLHFLEQFMRGDDTLTILGIRIPQIIAGVITIGASVIFYKRFKILFRKKRKSAKIRPTK